MADTAGTPAPDRHPGLILGIARFYYDPRGSMRAMLASGPGEPRLLAYAVIAALFLLAARLATLFATATAQTDLTARTLEQVVSVLFFVPLFYYGLAAVGAWIARNFGGQGTWFHGRAAFFWGVLVSAPILLLSTLVGIVLADTPLAAQIARQVWAVFFAWALANTFAEAFHFQSALKVLAVIVALSLALASLAWAIARA